MNKKYEYISFDCYGTLIDWETGILNFFSNIKIKYQLEIDDVTILNYYAKFEAEEEHKTYKPYKEILRNVYLQFGKAFSFPIPVYDEYNLAKSVKIWPPFKDSSFALQKLQEKYKLVIISNIDDDLFTYSQQLLNVNFNHVFTALQMKSYKPSLSNFKYVQESLSLHKDNWLHVAQSLYHDLKPINQLGIDSIWINRPSIAGEKGVAPSVDFTPTISFRSMEELYKSDLI
jgi:2-haloacid dehalogenase